MNFPIFTSTMAVGVFHAEVPRYNLLSSIMTIRAMAGAFLGTGRDEPRFDSLLVGAGVLGLGCTFAPLAPSYWFFAVALV